MLSCPTRPAGRRMQTLCALLCALPALAAAAKLPDDLIRCHINEMDTCLAPAVSDAIHKMKDGRKSLGVPSLNPLFVEAMTLDLGSGPIPLVIHGDNISISGVAESEITSASVDQDNHKLLAQAHTPRIRMDFTYNATGKILLVAVKGDGPAFIELQDVESSHIINAQPYEKKGKAHWNITDYSIKIKPKKMISHFEGLLKDPKVSDQINAFLNSDWETFFQQIQPPAQEAFGAIFQQITNKVFSRVPFDEIFIVS